jgi:hypothetical protein
MSGMSDGVAPERTITVHFTDPAIPPLTVQGHSVAVEDGNLRVTRVVAGVLGGGVRAGAAAGVWTHYVVTPKADETTSEA